MDDIILELKGLRKNFDSVEVLRGIDLKVKRGEFVTLLGSSGSGKTTILRIISGLETCDEGSVILEGEDVTDLPPNKRNVNTVFQSYALFPHMSVYKNIAYSLKLKKKSKAEIDEAVNRALKMVQLEGYGDRMPSELSGGQRQRVAIARTIVGEPKVLLLDEPLGALDLQLRRQMQLELKRLQKQLGITFIYITHDQEEAINMSDKIAVMRAGVFEQVGTAADVYDRPKTSYVAQFVGSANLISGTAKREEDGLYLDCCGARLPVSMLDYDIKDGAPLTVAVRSEQIILGADDGIWCRVTEKSFAGGMLRIVLKMPDGKEIVASHHGIDSELRADDDVVIAWAEQYAVPVDVEA